MNAIRAPGRQNDTMPWHTFCDGEAARRQCAMPDTQCLAPRAAPLPVSHASPDERRRICRGPWQSDAHARARCRADDGSAAPSAERNRSFAAIKCPPPPLARSGDAGLANTGLSKYALRGRSKCGTAAGLWMFPHVASLSCIVRVVGERLSLRRGQLVLDWGSGCGHMLVGLAQLYGVRGLGLDITDSAVAWASRHAPAGRFCAADGRSMAFLPADTFDAVVSYAALYHLPYPAQCETLKEMLRVTRVGGHVWIGWNGAHGRVEPTRWASHCLAGEYADAVELSVVAESELFVAPQLHAEMRAMQRARGPAGRRLRAPGKLDDAALGDYLELFFQYRSYSIFLTVVRRLRG